MAGSTRQIIFIFQLKQIGDTQQDPARALSFSLDFPKSGGGDCAKEVLELNTVYLRRVDFEIANRRFQIKLNMELSSAVGFAHVGSGGGALDRLQQEGDLTDVVVKCGSLEVKAHKAVLAAYSDTLKVAFKRSNFREAQQAVYTIDKDHLEPAVLGDVIKWMYRRPVEGMKEKAVELLAAADYFQMAELKAVIIISTYYMNFSPFQLVITLRDDN